MLDSIANLTHELKTPLHSILAIAGLLKAKADGPLTPEQEKQVDIILRNGQELLGLIVNLLDYSAAASDRIPKYELLQVQPLFKTLLDGLENVAKQQAIKLSTEYNLPATGFASDAFYLRQIVNNLLSNALKFSQGAEVSLHAKILANGALQLQVADSGIGMSVKVRDSIFNEFYQGDSGDSRSFGGVGLGLSLVQKSVTQLNGIIDVQSEEGQGTIFTVTIPSAADKIPASRLLVVEPDNGVRLSLEQLFYKEGYTVSSQSSLAGLIEKAIETRPQLLLLGLGDNRDAALNAVQTIRESEWGETLPIVIMSVFDSPQERASIFASGATDFVAKPFDVSEVAARVRMHCKR
jgi:CheY-like chemotaxis protein